MEEDVAAPAALGVAREFEVAQGEIADALHVGAGDAAAGEGAGDGGENKLIGAVDGIEAVGVAQFAIEHEGVIEAAGALENGAAPAAAAQHGDAVEHTGGRVYICAGGAAGAEDDEMSGAFPQAKALTVVVLGEFEEGFFEGEVFFGGGEGEVEVEHGFNGIT